MTLIEPVLVAAVALAAFFVGVACGSVVVSVAGAVVFALAATVVVVTVRRSNRTAAAWQKMPRSPSRDDDDVTGG